MDIKAFYTSLKEKGVHLWVEGDSLRYKVLSQPLHPDELRIIRQEKHKLMQLVTNEAVELKKELVELNSRWYNGYKLVNEGKFQTKEQKDSAERTFREIARRAVDIWEKLQHDAPELLEGVTLFPEPEDTEPVTPTGVWVNEHTWVPFELLEEAGK